MTSLSGPLLSSPPRSPKPPQTRPVTAAEAPAYKFELVYLEDDIDQESPASLSPAAAAPAPPSASTTNEQQSLEHEVRETSFFRQNRTTDFAGEMMHHGAQ